MKWKYQLLWLTVISIWVAAFTFNFPIARIPGPQGTQGVRGETGLQGEKGDTWYNDLPELYRQTSPAVVWIGAKYDKTLYPYGDISDSDIKWQGTGFLVGADGLIATAGHVVQDTKVFEVQFQDGSRAIADFVYAEDMSRCDVGFVQLRGDTKRPYLKFDTEVETGESLIILGHPWGLNSGTVLTQGIVSLTGRSEPFFGIKPVMQTDAAAWPGNSGGPVIDMKGNVVGIYIGYRIGCDNFSIVTPAKLVELAMQKALAEVVLREVE